MCSPCGGYCRGMWCPFCYAEAVKNPLKRCSQVYWKIVGGNQLCRSSLKADEPHSPLLPLLLLEMGTGNARGWGKGPFPSPAADSKASLSACLPPGSLSVEQRYLLSSENSSPDEKSHRAVVLMSLILGEQAGGSWPVNLQRPFEVAQPSSLTGCRLKSSQPSAGDNGSQITVTARSSVKCSTSQTSAAFSGNSCMGQSARTPTKPSMV